MLKIVKKFICAVLILALSFGNTSMTVLAQELPEYSVNSVSTNDMSYEEMVDISAAGSMRLQAAEIAYGELGTVGGSKYYGSGESGAWCAYFARWCVRQAGLDSTKWGSTGSTTSLVSWFKGQGRWHDKVNYTWSWNGITGGGSIDNYIPQPGDFAAVENNGNTSDGPGHTALVYSVNLSTNELVTIEGNISNKVVKRTYKLSDLFLKDGSASENAKVRIVGFGEPDYAEGRQPIGDVDFVEGGEGTVTVKGWAFDYDNPSAQLDVHVYVDGQAYLVKANKYRPDVNTYYGGHVGDYHGFESTFKVNERGYKQVVLYAIDIGDTWIGNTQIGITAADIKNVPFSISYDNTSVSTKVGNSTNISFDFTGDGIYTMAYTMDDYSIVSVTGFTSLDWSDGTANLLVEGLKAGTTRLYIHLMDSNNESLYHKAISVTVTQPVTGVSLNKSSTTIVAGKTETLTATVMPSNATNKTVTWSSSNTSVATVSNGIVTAKSAGTATITAKTNDGSYTATCKVTVTQPVTGVSLNKSSTTIVAGKTETLTATVAPSNATNKAVTWSSSNTGVATVSNGIVTAKSAGTATITAKTSDGGYTATCKVTVTQPITGVSLNKTSTTIEVGQSETLIATVTPSNATNKTVTWSSSNTSVATVSNGIVTAKSAGTATITVKTSDGSYTATCNVTVTQPVTENVPVTGISLNKTSIELLINGTESLVATIVPANATNTEVLWLSGNDDVAVVDSSGIVMGISAGETYIEVITMDGLYAARCIVSVTDPEQNQEPEVPVYNITFNSNGGSEVPGQTVEENRIVERPIDPLREGYRFIGWYVGEELYDFTAPVTGDIALEAKWELIIAEEPEPDDDLQEEPNVTPEDSLGDVLPEDIPVGGVNEIPQGLWIAGVDSDGYNYTGKAIKPNVRVYDYKTLLKEKTDYTIAYKNNINAAAYDLVNANGKSIAPSITVTGKGNYSGKDTVTFTILKKNLENEDIKKEDIVVNYTEKTQKPVPTVTWNGRKLVNKKDFTVSYPELTGANPDAYKVAGTYPVEITGKGNYEGTITAYITITNNILISKTSVSKISSQPYAWGEEIKPALTVKYKGDLLFEGTDYVAEYSNNIEVGTANILITGIGRFSGQKKVTFKVSGVPIKNAKVESLVKSVSYTGQPITPEFIVNYVENGEVRTLMKDRNFTVTYEKNVNVGTATVLIKGINNFTGTLKKTFKINKYDLNMDKANAIAISMPDSVVYEKGGSRPKPVVCFKGNVLTEGKDYTITYKNNALVNDGSDEAKMPTVIITGKGNFTKNISETFLITQKDISQVSISVSDKVYNTKINGFKSVPVLTDTNGKKLALKKDYLNNFVYTYAETTVTEDGVTHQAGQEIGNKDVLKVGTLVNVAVTGANNYTGCITGQYRIIKTNISKTKVSVEPQVYTGRAVTLTKDDIKVMNGKFEVPKDEFEIISYSNNNKKGTAKVIIKGVGDTYGGTKTVSFKIKAKSFLWWRK